MLNKVFVYDDTLMQNILDILQIKPISEQIAESVGKMFIVARKPVALQLTDLRYNRGLRKIFGAIYTFNPDDMPKVLDALDNYNACSASRIGFESRTDLCYRTTVKAYPIHFENIQEFQTFRYTYGKSEDCYMYFGNPEHEAIIYAVKVIGGRKVASGIYKKGFFNLLERKGIKND